VECAQTGCDLPCRLHSHARRLRVLGKVSAIGPRNFARFTTLSEPLRVSKLWFRGSLVSPPGCDHQVDPRDAVPIFSQPGFSPRIPQPLKIALRNTGQRPASARPV
jgi:hypothetical protein